jgi:hypothetical protein
MRMKMSVIAFVVAIGCWAAGDTVRGSAHAAQECEYSVSPTRVGVDGSAQSAVVQVDTAPGCAWTATVDVGWLNITAGGSGAGPGSISYAVSAFAPSSDFPIRQGHVQVRWNTPTAGQNVQVTQSTGTCHASFSRAPGPTSPVTFGALGGGGNAWVLADSAFTGPWFVDGASDWITPTSPALGVLRGGDGQAFFAVSPNPSSAPRDGTITFCSGQTMNVHQSGRVPNQRPFVPSDFDGDGIADLAVFRPATSEWFVLQSHSGYSYSDSRTYFWGSPSDMQVPGDFDGDARTDLAVFRPQGLFGAAPAGNWDILYSSNQFNQATETLYAWPTFHFDPQAVSLLADFSGDGKQDLGVYSPLRGEWNIVFASARVAGSGLSSMQWGLPGDVPVPADFDGDGKADLAVWRPSSGTWFVRYSSNGYSVPGAASFQWGLPGDVPQTGDFDGDRKSDFAVWRPAEGRWYILRSSTSYTDAVSYQWGLDGDIPMPNDFDGDGRTDLAVWRPSNGTWYLLSSISGYSYAGARSYQWGLPGDLPIGPRTRTSGLNLTLTQGEHLTGPYSGTVTGPNGFSCTIGYLTEFVSCLRQPFQEGTIIQLHVTLINPLSGARPIKDAFGCDTVANGTCTVVIHGEKNVTIAVGCEIGCSALVGAEPSLQAPLASRAPRRDHDGHEVHKDR